MADRRRLPPDRSGVTRRFEIGNYKVYATVNTFVDGTPGEIFVHIAKTGSTLSGLLDGWAINFSMALQYGIPLGTLLDKMINTRFPPEGHTDFAEIGYAKSVFDMLGRWLSYKFVSAGEAPAPGRPSLTVPPAPVAIDEPSGVGDGPPCPACGSIMRRVGKCWGCECGESTGCG